MRHTVTSSWHLAGGATEEQVHEIMDDPAYATMSNALGTAVVGRIADLKGHPPATISGAKLVSVQAAHDGLLVTGSFDVEHGLDKAGLVAELEDADNKAMWTAIWSAIVGYIAVAAGHPTPTLSRLTVVSVV
jgi:hypothetical protein